MLLFYSSRSSWGDTKKVVMGPSFVGRIDVRQWKALELVGQDRKLGAVQLGSVPPRSAAAPDRQVFALATPSDHAMSMAKRQDMRLHPWPARIALAIAVRKSFPTIFVEPVLVPAQAINKNAPTSGASLFMAERQGFEPWNTREDVTGIPVQRLRPLGHLSVILNSCVALRSVARSDWNCQFHSSALLRTSMCFAPVGPIVEPCSPIVQVRSERT